METIRAFYHRPKTATDTDAGLTEILSLLTPRPGCVLLDIGCYDGRKTAAIRDFLGAAETVGMDFLEDRLAEARLLGMRTILADLNAGPLDLPSASFDVIVCSEVIEHVFSPDDLFDEIARLLQPGGWAVLTTPNLASWKNRIALSLGWQPFLSEISTRSRYGNPLVSPGRPSGHIRLFTLRALLEMARAHGLRPTLVRGAALRSPQKNLIGLLSRAADSLIGGFPSLADRLLVRLEK